MVMTPEEVRVACARLNWTYRELARFLHVSAQTVSKWASGRSKVPYAAAVLIRQELAEKERGSGDAEFAEEFVQ